MNRIIKIFVVMSLACIGITESNAQVIINEILACNNSVNVDEINKDFSDWIELYNTSDEQVSIGNWYLSDRKTDPTKWMIPFYFSLAPQGYKLFWADNLNSSNHMSFKLSAEGESIYLFNSDTILIDSVRYPSQITDITYGRISGGDRQWRYLQKATPNDKNPNMGIDIPELSEQPVFSYQAGYYKSAISLELSVNSNSEKIYYTLDGSIPDRESNQYVSPIQIHKTTTVRARAIADNKLPGKIVTQTYLINESVILPVVSLTMDPKYLWDKNFGIYVKGTKYRDTNPKSANYFRDWERPVNVEYFDTKGDQGFNINAGIKIHGRSTRNYEQKSLAIFVRDKYDDQTITNNVFCESSPDTLKAFLLRNAGNDWGVTMFLDGLVHTLVMNDLDIDAQLYQPAILFLNGEYWGIHNIREKINKHYIQSKYPNDTIKMDIIEADYVDRKMIACEGSMDEYNKLINFIENNELSKEENYSAIKELVDVDELIDYLITEVYIGNRDWPHCNVKLWKYREDSAKWRWILYDTELAFKKSNEYFKFSIFEHMLAENTDIYPTPRWANNLLISLFENEEFKNEFLQRMAVYLHTVFDTEHVFQVIDSLKVNIEPEVNRNQEKWGGIRHTTFPFLTTSTNQTEWEANINFMKRYISDRPSDLRRKAMDYFQVQDTISFQLSINDHSGGYISLMGIKLNEESFDGYIFADTPVRVEAIPSEGYEFVKWKGGDYDEEFTEIFNKDKKLTAVFKKIE